MAPPTPSVYRTRAYVQRRRALIGLAGAGLLLTGYGIRAWQDAGSAPPAAAAQPVPPPAAAAQPVPQSIGPGSSSPPATTAPRPRRYPVLQAEAATLTGVQTQDTEDQGGGQNVGWIANGDSIEFGEVDFGPVAATKVQVRVATDATAGGRMDLHVDAADGPVIGTLNVTNTGGWQSWRTDEVDITPTTGVHKLVCVFVRDDGDEFLNLNWLLLEH